MLLLLLGCDGYELSKVPPGPDLAERLSSGQVRAGVVSDTDALFGGVAAEGASGDVKIYNANVQFVVQGLRTSNYYVEHGGGVIDLDIVRPEGQPGRDVLDEMLVMAGIGRVVAPTSIEVLADGSDGEARVRVVGEATPMSLVTGAVESPDAIPDLDLHIVTDYVLEPDAWTMRMETTVENREDDDVTLSVGDAGFMAAEVIEGWRPGEGREPEDDAAVRWNAVVGQRNEIAVALLAEEGELELGGASAILAGLGPFVFGFAAPASLAPGETTSFTRRLGVAPDPATLSGEQVARAGDAETVSGTVTADGSPVAGARVTVLDEAGDPLTLAFTDDAGAWSAVVEPGAAASFVASGRGPAYAWDLPEGAGWPAPYAADDTLALRSLAEGAPPIPFAEGYGYAAASASTDLTLTPPAALAVTVADGGPALVRVAFASADPVVADDRFVPGRPGGYAAIGFVRDGDLVIPLEPGAYFVEVSRGARGAVTTAYVTLAAGEATTVAADVSETWSVGGVFSGDPHMHASPSGDGGCSMEQRLLSVAAFGVDVHFGTDHDHVVDYRPLLAPLGLEDHVVSVVADEVSPVLRGHFNAWPATRDATAPNGGAPGWWLGYADTAEIFGWMRALVGDDGVVSTNHPVGNSGMFTLAGYDPTSGSVRLPDHWSSDFQASEVLNSGEWAEFLPYWLDLTSRGSVVAPLGVSDAHGPTSGGIGASFTWFVTDAATVTDDTLVAAVRDRRTVASTGPYVDVRAAGDIALGETLPSPATLDVTVYAPDWMPVETVALLRDGEVVATEACVGQAPTPCAVTWTLEPEADAAYVVQASSASVGMSAVQPGTLAWAVTSPVLVDVGGDGWTAPLPPLMAE